MNPQRLDAIDELALIKHLMEVGQLVGEAVKETNGNLDSRFFHDIINCYQPLQVTEWTSRLGRIKRVGRCITHQVAVCYCGWEKGHHFEYSPIRGRRKANGNESGDALQFEDDSLKRRVAVFG